MWIFMNNAMLSVVEHKDDPTKLLVRARVRGDIERVFPDSEPFESYTSDYHFRAFIDRKIVADAIAKSIQEIDYVNFKDSVKGPSKIKWKRKVAYHKVWEAMMDLQEDLLGPKSGRIYNWWETYRYGKQS